MADIGAKIALEGEKQFKQELANITQAGKTLSAEMNNLSSSFDKADASEEDLAKVSKKLNEQVENQRKLVDKLKEAVQRSSEKTGENSTETLKWKERLAKAETELGKLEKQADGTGKEVGELAKEEENASDKTSVFGDVLKANLASEIIKKGVQALANAVEYCAKFFVEAVKGAAEYTDTVLTLSKTTGMSTDAIQEYQYAAKLLDVEFSTIEGSLTKLTKTMSSAKNGGKAAASTFEKLGIRITDANGELRDSNDVFDDVIDVLGKMTNETERDAVAMEVFGKSAKDLNPLIEAGTDAMTDFRKEAKKVGAVLDKDTLDSLGAVQDAFDRLSGTWDALKRTLGAKIGIKILPELEKITKAFQKLAETGDITGFVEDVTKQISDLVKKIPTLVRKIAKELPKALKTLANSDLWTDLAEAIGDTLAAIFENLPELIEAGGELIGAIIRGAVMILPNMIMRLVNGFDEELDELDDVTNEHVEAVRKKIAELPNILEDVEDDLDSINGKQRESERWIEVFDELSKKTKPTAKDTERLKTAVDQLNALYPDLGLVLDEETGKWSLNTQEIRNNIAAMSDRARADAYIKAASQRYEEIVELERARDELQSELDAVETRLTEATAHAGVLREQIPAVEELNKKLKDGEITVDEYKEAWHDLGIEIEPQFGEMRGVYGETINMLDTNLVRLTTDLNNTETAIKGIEREKKPLVDGVRETQTAIDGLNGEVEWFYQKADSFSGAVVKPISGAAKEAYKAAENVGIQLDRGVKKGIDDGKGIVVAAARSMIRSAITQMKTTAQINSPSKLTRDLIGKNLALGVVEGWEDVFSSTKMRNAFSLRGAIDEMGSGNTVTNNANYGGVTVNVTARDGESADALADAIMRKIQSAVNQRKAVFA